MDANNPHAAANSYLSQRQSQHNQQFYQASLDIARNNALYDTSPNITPVPTPAANNRNQQLHHGNNHVPYKPNNNYPLPPQYYEQSQQQSQRKRNSQR